MGCFQWWGTPSHLMSAIRKSKTYLVLRKILKKKIFARKKLSGHAGGGDPRLDGFDVAFYLAANPDVAAAGADPEEHFLTHGLVEGRPFRRAVQRVITPEEAAQLPEGFDPSFYLAANPDVAAAALDPVTHYLEYGQHESRPYQSLLSKELDPVTAAKLPIDFDPEFYLFANPDLAALDCDPVEHYLAYGRGEGRIYRPARILVSRRAALDPQRRTVLVVSHEASRTGAPVLCLKIAQQLSQRYNVIALLLKGGPLAADFQATANITAEIEQRAPGDCSHALSVLKREASVDAAVVNSVVSFEVLEPLAMAAIPSVSLLHEFATYVFPRANIVTALRWATHTVFSARIISNDAQNRLPDWTPTATTHLFPQGRCVLDGNPEAEIVDAAFHPHDWPQNTRVIMGAGTFEFRKGVDWFFQCAAQILARSADRNIRFVWFGRGYKPETDMGYSVYIQEQIRRSGLERHVVIIQEVGSLEYAYTRADALLLTSRLDPLPNVGIDGICHGLPVLCFSDASGIAEILEAEPVGEALVSAYGDTAGMADRAVRLLSDPDHLAAVKASLMAIGERRFSMEGYIRRVEEVMTEAEATMAEDERDIAALLASGRFDLDHWNAFRDGGPEQTLEQAVRCFVREIRSGIRGRMPKAGIDLHDMAAERGEDVSAVLRAFATGTL